MDISTASSTYVGPTIRSPEDSLQREAIDSYNGSVAWSHLTSTMPTSRARPWDAADHLESGEDVVAYLQAAFEDGDPALIAAALGDIARARGMTKVAADAGLRRGSLYKALSPNGNLEFVTVLKVMQALGLGLRVSAVKAH